MGKVKDEPTDEPGTPEQFEVEEIKDKRILEDGRVQYYLKWKGYTDADNTWENEDDIDCDKLIREFNRALAEKEAEVNGEEAGAGDNDPNDSDYNVEDENDPNDDDFEPASEKPKSTGKRGRPPKRNLSTGAATVSAAKKRKATTSGQVKPAKNFALADLKSFDEMLDGNEVEKILEIGKRGSAMITLVKLSSASSPIVVSWDALKRHHPQTVIHHLQSMLRFCD